MAIILKSDIAKARPAVTNAALKRLINQREPQLAFFLVRFWDRQRNALTYAELRQLVLSNQIDEEIMQRWYDEYS